MTPPNEPQAPASAQADQLAAALLEALQDGNADCLSCNACRLQCAIHAATGRLQPLRLVRLASSGLLDELLRTPEVWACMQCERCISHCPMSVRPAELVRQLRSLALLRGAVDGPTLQRYDQLCATFQRVRWHMVAACVAGQDPADAPAQWDRWAATPVGSAAAAEQPARIPVGALRVPALAPSADTGEPAPQGVDDHRLQACMTCSECSTACPIAHERTVFDPVRLFRQVALGLGDELLDSPSIWLCLSCEACTAACAQGVSGHGVIAALQDAALRQERVPADLRERLWAFEQGIYTVFLERLATLLAG